MTLHTVSQHEPTIDVAIIGGGASGMIAALTAREQFLSTPSTSSLVTIFEQNERLGKKLLSTGNGRCNITNTDNTLSHYHGSDTGFLKETLRHYTPQRIISLFEGLGLVCTVEEGGKVYPSSLHASSVLDSLRLALEEKSIVVKNNMRVTAIEKRSNLFTLTTSGKRTFFARTIVVATGGKCAPATGSDGNGFSLLQRFSHTLIPPLPAIVQLTTNTQFVKPLAGNKIQASVSLTIDNRTVRVESGEVLFTSYGLSGPPILQLSGYVSRALHPASTTTRHNVSVVMDFLPHLATREVIDMLTRRKEHFPHRCLEEFLTGLFHRRLAFGILKLATGKPLSYRVAALTGSDIVAIAQICKFCTIAVTGTMPFTNAQTTAGGIATAEFDTSTFESKHCPGLFSCGEILDVDGDCGGYNLHWAWASGHSAGNAAATYCRQEYQ